MIEPYGFSPRSAYDGDAVRAVIESGASDVELQDITEEMMMTRCLSDAGERADYMRAWRAAGMTCIFQNAGEEGQDPLRLMKRLARFTHVTDLFGDFVRRGVDAADIEAAKNRIGTASFSPPMACRSPSSGFPSKTNCGTSASFSNSASAPCTSLTTGGTLSATAAPNPPTPA